MEFPRAYTDLRVSEYQEQSREEQWQHSGLWCPCLSASLLSAVTGDSLLLHEKSLHPSSTKSCTYIMQGVEANCHH